MQWSLDAINSSETLHFPVIRDGLDEVWRENSENTARCHLLARRMDTPLPNVVRGLAGLIHRDMCIVRARDWFGVMAPFEDIIRHVTKP